MSARSARHLGRWLLVLLMLALGGHAEAARRPNVVVLLTDDQRWDALGVVQRELGAAALDEYRETKHIWHNVRPAVQRWFGEE